MNLTPQDLFTVKDKIALVTGGGTGIGKMLVMALASNGATVYITSRKLSVLEQTTKEINDTLPNPKVFAIQSNLLTKQDCDQLASDIKQRVGRLDILINNAGMSWGEPLNNFNEQKGWDALFALNVKSIFYLTVALLPLLEKSKSTAKVINVSSISSFIATAETPLSREGSGTWSYNASKAAVNQLTQSMALTLSKKGITCNAIAPGYFPSRMTQFGLQELEKLKSGIPMGRIGGLKDMAALGLFLCSNGSDHLAGVIIPIDGGQGLLSRARL